MTSEYGNVSIVISGISGAFPKCDNVNELAEKLYSKENLVTPHNVQWAKELQGMPQHLGAINKKNKFDATFFGIHPKTVNSINPEMRLLLEKTYEAIIDSGTNPNTLRGSNTGVFAGMCLPTYSSLTTFSKSEVNENSGSQTILLGNHIYANLISYCFDLKGPSSSVDTACSSASFALAEAFKAIKNGECDAAIVATANICTYPKEYILGAPTTDGLTAKDGKCKAFDESGDGFVSAESVCVMLVQKSNEAHRKYAEIINAISNNDGYKMEGQPYPSRKMQATLLSKFYINTRINPNDVSWIEAHGTGTTAGDKAEAGALDDVLGKFREKPLLVGSVKSNLGHTEGSAGLVGITKILISMEKGVIPSNLHYKSPKKDIESLVAGRIKVIDEHLKWEGGYVGANSFGIGGVNCHVLLKSNEKIKVASSSKSVIVPIAVYASGRTEEAVETITSHFESTNIDVEQIRLIHEIHQQNIQGHLYRGFVVIGDETNVIKHVQRFSEIEREVWFVFSGMGSQWPGMAHDMMKLPVFAESIRKLHDVLKPHGIDLIRVLTEGKENSFTNLLNCFIGITAMQIALVDILNELEIKPDKVIGHSFGEIVCAYADGCLTAEQAILCSYYRGKCTTEAENITGMMASIGLGFNDVKRLLPESVVVACHNSSTNCTISGPKQEVEEFLEVLRAREIFVQEVYTEQIAYHSEHVTKASLKYFNYLKKIITTNKERSSRWISTSISQVDWNKESSKYCSPEYFTNNLVSSVLFEEASSLITENALLIEISPHGILHPILRRSLNENAITIPLMAKNQPDSLVHMLSSIGRLYEEGIHPKIHKLYPPVEFPVSRGTPMISPLVKWEHSDDWFVYKHKFECNGVRDVKISLHDKKYNYLEGHVVDGRNVLPATGYLVLVWETFAMMNGQFDYTKFPVVLENLKFVRATIIPKKGDITLRINIQSGENGIFEVTEKGATCVEGKIMKYIPNGSIEFLPNDYSSDLLDIPMNDIYREYQISGFTYKGLFRGLLGMNIEGTRGLIQWNGDYVTFLDNVLQSVVMGMDQRSPGVPTSIRKLVIDVDRQMKLLIDYPKLALPVTVSHKKDVIQCGGVQVTNMLMTHIYRNQANQKQPVLRKYQFAPFRDETEHNLEMAVEVSFNIMIDNLDSPCFKAIEILNDLSESCVIISNILYKYIADWLNLQPNMTIFYDTKNDDILDGIYDGISVKKGNTKSELDAFLIITHNMGNQQTKNLRSTLKNMRDGSYLLCVEHVEAELDLKYIDAVCCLNYKCGQIRVILLRKKTSLETNEKFAVVKIDLNDYGWIGRLQNVIKEIQNEENKKLVIYSEEDRSGIIGFYKCLKREFTTDKIRCFFIQDKRAPSFDLQEQFYVNQLRNDCPLNVYKDGAWGTYCHLQMKITETSPVEFAHLDILRQGDLSSLKWIADNFNSNRRPLLNKEKQKEDILFVHYASLNFRDIMLATGSLPEVIGIATSDNKNCLIGCECVGTTIDGRRFVGMRDGGCFATQQVIADLNWVAEIPKMWSMEDAATVPLAYFTAISGLITRGNIRRGESILIHSATGGVGQAVINIATYYECEIYVTVGTPEKKEFIRKHFPQIPEENIGNSRDTSFEDMIRERTSGVGVDVVLNSLSDEKLTASLRCLAEDGRFIEMGKSDIFNNNPLGMGVFKKGISFDAIVTPFHGHYTDANKNKFLELMREGWIKPLVRKVYQKYEVEEAFRFMASGKHIGKILIKISDEEDFPKRMTTHIDAIPRYLCLPEKSYIICGGLGGSGLELALWLTSRGARNIVVSSRNGMKTNYQRYIVEKWKRAGAKVVISTDDIATEEGAKGLIEKASNLGPVSAIFNLALVLHDALFENQTEDTFGTVVAAKILGTSNLDLLSRTMCPSLEHFVVFSSAASGCGSYGQTNYGWANSSAEMICEQRRSLGFSGLSIQWGTIGDVGIAAQMIQDDPTVSFSCSLIAQNIRSCLDTVDKFLHEKEAIVSSWIPANKETVMVNEKVSLVDRILGLLGIKDLKNVSMQATLAQSGLDSFTSNELRQIFEMEYEIMLSVPQVRSLTFAKVLELTAKNEIKDRKSMLEPSS